MAIMMYRWLLSSHVFDAAFGIYFIKFCLIRVLSGVTTFTLTCPEFSVIT